MAASCASGASQLGRRAAASYAACGDDVDSQAERVGTGVAAVRPGGGGHRGVCAGGARVGVGRCAAYRAVQPGDAVCVVVDAVSEVLSISDEDIEPPPRVGFGPDNRSISGLGKVGGDVKLILNAGILIEGERYAGASELASGAS